jgi:NADPH2:quinone reductase
VPLAPAILLAGNKGVPGYSLSNLRQDDPRHLVATARRAIDLLMADQIHIAIAETLPLEQAALAHQRMESINSAGKLLLQVQ